MPEQQPSKQQNSKPVKKENTFLNLGFNLVLPILLLNKGKQWFGERLEPYFENVAVGVLLIALAFPVGYFVYDYFKRKKYNLFSIIGLISVLLTGGIGILSIPTEWFAVKEAAIPFILGMAVVISLKTPYPLVRTLLFNPEIMHVDRVQEALREHDAEAEFEKLLTFCTWLLAGSFLLSAVLNFILARWIVVSPSGTDAFNAEVSKMMAWSWPIIAIPSMAIMIVALYKLLGGIKRMTGLELEQVLQGAEAKS
ncbi:MAG TPA: VC0807 family protein [Opitutales bacterium]|nr:VC0807 family protein [Opitutales bacterium]